MRVVLPLLILAIAGCARRPITTSDVLDSVRVETRFVRDTVLIPGDTVTLAPFFVQCDSVTNKPVPIEKVGRSGRAAVRIMVDRTGQVRITSTCDSLLKVIEVKQTTINHLRKELTTKIKIEYRTYWYDRYSRPISLIVVTLIAVWLGLKLRRVLPGLMQRLR